MLYHGRKCAYLGYVCLKTELASPVVWYGSLQCRIGFELDSRANLFPWLHMKPVNWFQCQGSQSQHSLDALLILVPNNWCRQPRGRPSPSPRHPPPTHPYAPGPYPISILRNLRWLKSAITFAPSKVIIRHSILSQSSKESIMYIRPHWCPIYICMNLSTFHFSTF